MRRSRKDQRYILRPSIKVTVSANVSQNYLMIISMRIRYAKVVGFLSISANLIIAWKASLSLITNHGACDSVKCLWPQPFPTVYPGVCIDLFNLKLCRGAERALAMACRRKDPTQGDHYPRRPVGGRTRSCRSVQRSQYRFVPAFSTPSL
jgi:hypothetical protein